MIQEEQPMDMVITIVDIKVLHHRIVVGNEAHPEGHQVHNHSMNVIMTAIQTVVSVIVQVLMVTAVMLEDVIIIGDDDGLIGIFSHMDMGWAQGMSVDVPAEMKSTFSFE
ncbi:hypothetical protein LTS17_003175 [Exophiala oligosperma]